METRKFKTPYKHRRIASPKDFSQHRLLGAAPINLPSELLALTPVLNQGNKPSCTAYTAVAIRQAMTGNTYDPEGQWELVKQFIGNQNPNGLELKDQLACGVKRGFSTPMSAALADPATAYFFINSRTGDWFDTVRTRIFQLYQKYGKVIPLSIGVNWYSDWDGNGLIPNQGKYLLGGHDTKIGGFKVLNGENVIVIQNSWGQGLGDGGLFYATREVFNKWFDVFGAGYWVDDPNLEKDNLNLFISILSGLKAILQTLVNSLKPSMKPVEPKPIVPIDEVIPDPAPKVEKYDWSTKEAARHSVRLICDEENLSWDMKNRLDKTVEGESNFNPKAVGKINPNGSTDWGIAQWNDRLWIGNGKLFPSTDYVLTNPEHCIREMCRQFKLGHANYWVAYKKLFPNG